MFGRHDSSKYSASLFKGGFVLLVSAVLNKIKNILDITLRARYTNHNLYENLLRTNE